MAYKMIVLDLDGTLTNNKKEITPRTYEALMEAQKKGIVVVLASGRPTYGIMPLAKQLKLAEYGGYILAYNGGKIMDCKSGDTVFNQELCPDLVPMLYDEAMKAGVQILTYQGDGIAATKADDEYVEHEAFINKMPVVEYSDFKDLQIYNEGVLEAVPVGLGEPGEPHYLPFHVGLTVTTDDYIVIL